MEYAVDPNAFRGEPTPEEKALHCLFLEPFVSKEAVPGKSLLPGFSIRISINDRLCWSELCDFEELGKMLHPGSGTFTPFVTYCTCPECEASIAPILSVNTGEWIEWTTEFPRDSTGYCGSADYRNDQLQSRSGCNLKELKTAKQYRFSASQFRDEVLALARTIQLIDSCGETLLGGPLSPTEQENAYEKYLKNRDIFLQLDYSSYQIRKEEIERLLQTDFSELKNPLAFVAPAAEKDLPAAETKPEEPRNNAAEMNTSPDGLPDPLFITGADDTPPEYSHVLVPNNIFRPLLKGMKRHRLVRINYRDAGGDSSRRKILPEILVRTGNIWYCAAYCYLRKERRTFRLDRISRCVLKKRTGKPHGIADDVRKNGLFPAAIRG